MTENSLEKLQTGGLKKIRGPRRKFLFGHALEMRGDMLGFFAQLAKDYGDVAGFYIFNIYCCLINDPILIERVLVNEAERTTKSWDFKYLKILLGEGLLTSEGELWKRERNMIQPAFHPKKVGDYAPVMVGLTEKLLTEWKEGEVADLHSEMSRLTLEIVGATLFGEDFSQYAVLVVESLNEFMKHFEKMFNRLLPIPMNFPTPGYWRLKKKIKALDKLLYAMIRRRRQDPHASEDLVSHLINAAERSGELIDDKQIRDELVTFVMAGHETTSLALSWTLMLISQHPEVEAKLLEEFNKILGEGSPNRENFTELHYTRQVLEEGMRLYPPAWGLGREAKEDLNLNGYVLPRGTQIFLVQYLTQRDPRFFERPEEFRPERWSPENRRKIPKFAYFPFGGGPRSCIGMHFALQEAQLVLPQILQRFHLDLIPNQKIELQASVTLRPRYGIKMRISKR